MKKIYKKLMVAAATLIGFSSMAQVSAYAFAQSVGTYNAITGGTLIVTPTANTLGGSADDIISNIPNGSFPFPFVFNSVSYTGCNISTNGFITFGATAPGAGLYIPISDPTAYSGAISGWGGDLNAPFALGTPTVSGQIRVEVLGSAPNRTLVVQYSNWRPAYTTSTSNAPVINFQIRLEETTNVVSIIYGPSTFLVGSTNGTGTREIGLRGASNADYNNRTNSSSVLFTASTAGASNAAVQNYATVTSTPGMPSNGLTYKWTPPAVCAGAPAANTAIATPTSVCFGGTSNINLASTYTVGGITYQWYSAPSVGGPYTAITSATNSAYSATNIAATTFYQAVITCTNGPASTTSTPVQVLIPATTTSAVPYFEGFEGITSNNQLPNCSWLITNTAICQTYSVTPPPTVYNRVPHTGNAFASFRYATAANGDYFFTNGINLTAGTTYSASSFYINDGTAGFTEFAMLYGTTQSTTGLVNIASVTGNITNTTYSLLANTFTVPTTGVYYIAVKGTGPTFSPWYLTWDDLSITVVPGCSSASGGVLSSASMAACAGSTIGLNSTGATIGTGITYQWQVSNTAGGPYTNVVGGSGATTTSYTSAALPAGTYYYVLKTTCTLASLTGLSNEATVTINPVPSANASANGPLCSGQTLNLTGGTNIGTTFMWMGPASFTSNVQNPSFVSPLGSGGTYTLLVSTPNCTSAPSTVSVTVNTTPPAFVLSPSSAAFCAGGSQTISASISVASPTLNYGTQANQNATTGYPAPYSVYFGGQKMQMLVLASELTAAGFVPGTPLSSLQFPVVSLGSNWGTTLNNCQNFQVNIGATTLTALSSFQTGLTNVLAPMNFTPVVGYSNIHSFSNLFIWDGTSNIILETTFSNNLSGVTNDNVVQYNTPTSFQSTILYRADSQTASTIAAATATNGTSLGLARPDFKLNGLSIGSYSWTPSSSLSASNTQSVIATPVATTNYTVMLANAACSSSATVNVSVTPIPVVSISATPTTICSGGSVTFTANGATTYSWSTTSTNTVLTVSPTTNTVYTVVGANGTCTSSAVQSVTVNANPTVNISSTNTTICSGASVTFTASGASTYSWNTTSTNTVLTVSPTANTVYTVVGTTGSCTNSAVQSVSVNATPTVGASSSASLICNGQTASLTATGANTYSWNTTSTNTVIAVSPTVTTSYTVTGTTNGCSSTFIVSQAVSPCTGLSSNVATSTGILVYPNPNTGMFTIELNNGSIKNIDVMDLTGRIVASESTSNDKVDFEINNLANGVYYVRIQSNNSVEVIKIIKQ